MTNRAKPLFNYRVTSQYSNLVVVNHSPTEFVLDFVNIMPGSPKAKVCSRLILTPQHAKKFLRAISENLCWFPFLRNADLIAIMKSSLFVCIVY